MLLRVGIAAAAPQRRRLERLLPRDEVVATSAAPRESLVAYAVREGVDLLLVSADRLGPNAVELLSTLQSLPDRTEVIVLWNREDPQLRARLIAGGALAVLFDGLRDDEIGGTLRSLLQRVRDLQRQYHSGESARPSLEDFISESPSIREFIRIARRVLESDATLLIQGETGTGKERLARAMHAEGPRSNGPFVAVNCGALVEGLFESELFGHVEGAFTGAMRSRRGLFEVAHKGSLFLDEIGELPLALQPKLLRVLEERVIQPVGTERTLRVDVRLIAATNRDLNSEVGAGRFRSDLFYRLNVVTLTIPPLRERREDVPGIVRNQLHNLCARLARPLPEVSPEALDALTAHRWPGNVRELINVLERALLIDEDAVLGLDDFPPSLSGSPSAPTGSFRVPDEWFDLPLAEATKRLLADFERAYLDRLLSGRAGKIGLTSCAAGLNPRVLYAKMRALGMRKESYRRPRRAPNP